MRFKSGGTCVAAAVETGVKDQSSVQMTVAGMQVPTLDEITKKEQTIKEALNYKFNDKDIEDVSLLAGTFAPVAFTKGKSTVLFCFFGTICSRS